MRLSVIIPGYNTPVAWWDRCLRSVLAAVPAESEIICVDDASAVRPEVTVADPRIRWICQEVNRGQAVARNTGLAAARGEYVAFVDSDDEAFPEIYKKAIEQLERDGADVAVYGVRQIWINNGLMRDDICPSHAPGPLTGEVVSDLLRHYIFTFPWNKVMRRAFLREKNISFVERAIPREDEVFSLDLVLAGAKWTIVPELGQTYYRTEGSSIARFRRYGSEPDRQVAATWRKALELLGHPADLEHRGRFTELDAARSEWGNMWLRGTSYSLGARWRWLKAHPELGGIGTFVAKAVFMALRNHCYWRPIRRWHIKRICPTVQEREGAS